MHRFDWKLLESDYLYTDEWLTARLDKCQMPDGTVVYPYYVLEYADWVNVVALTKEDDIVLVRQYRHGIGRTIIELPCGVVEQGESAGEAMRRELLEETGYLAENMFEMAVLSPNAATNANMSHFFLGCRQTPPPMPTCLISSWRGMWSGSPSRSWTPPSRSKSS